MRVLARRRLQAAVGQLELIGMGKRIHIVGPCEHLLGSHTIKYVGRHEGTALHYGPYGGFHIEVYWLLWANLSKLLGGTQLTECRNCRPIQKYALVIHDGPIRKYTLVIHNGPIRKYALVIQNGPIRSCAHIYKKRAHDGFPDMYG
jgi:hypothetical protein